MTDTCEPGSHDLGEPGPWTHPAGTTTAYRERTCGRCGHVETEGMGLADDRLDLGEVEVVNGRLDGGRQSVAEALTELART